LDIADDVLQVAKERDRREGRTTMRALLDISVLIALLDSDHSLHSQAVVERLAKASQLGFTNSGPTM